MKNTLLLMGVLLSLCAAASHGETWLDIDSKPTEYFFQVDLDSVARVEDGRYAVSWRSGHKLPRPEFVVQATVDCPNEFVELAMSTHLETDPILSRYQPLIKVIDYAAVTRTFDGQSKYLTESERARRVDFPGPGSRLNKVIRQICQHESTWTSRPEIAMHFQKWLGCESGGRVGPLLCAKDPATIETLYLMFFRLEQVTEVCGTSRPQLDLVLHSWLATLEECTKTTNCGLPLVQMYVSSLGDDLSRAFSKQACSSIQTSIVNAIDDQGRRDSVARFNVCVVRSIPVLDDRISAADVIAYAVLGACRGELTPRLAQSKVFAENVMPRVTAAVLEHRTQTSKPPRAKPAPRPKLKES